MLSAAVAYRSSMARRASPGYNRVAGTNAIGCDTQEDGVTLLPRAITFSAGAGSTGLVIQGALTSTWPFRFGNIAGLSGGNAGASRTIDGFMGGQTVRSNSRSYRLSSLAINSRSGRDVIAR